MNNKEARNLIDAAKLYKTERISEVRLEIEELNRATNDAERRLEAWSKMIPFDVAEEMAKAEELAKTESNEIERTARLEHSHKYALQQAYDNGKAILPPEASSKSTTCGLIGVFLVGGLILYIATFHFHIRNELGLAILSILAAIVGLFAGFAYFDHNFVIDESLERSIFAKFTAHVTSRKTYIKNSR